MPLPPAYNTTSQPPAYHDDVPDAVLSMKTKVEHIARQVDAKQSAETIVTEAQTKADAIVENAKSAAEQILTEARQETSKMIANAKEEFHRSTIEDDAEDQFIERFLMHGLDSDRHPYIVECSGEGTGLAARYFHLTESIQKIADESILVLLPAKIKSMLKSKMDKYNIFIKMQEHQQSLLNMFEQECPKTSDRIRKIETKIIEKMPGLPPSWNLSTNFIRLWSPKGLVCKWTLSKFKESVDKLAQLL